MYIQPKLSRTFIGRFEFNDDLLAALTDFCRHKKIRTGTFQLIGAVQNAKLGFYDQKKKKYAGCTEINKKLEIASCSGNISLNHGEIFVHAHIVLADLKGRAFGGHLMPGTKVFAAEFCIQEFTGDKLIRTPEPVTKLPLWK